MIGEVKARFEEHAMPHLDCVYRVARILTANAGEAEDLTQETFVRAYRAFGSFELREYGAKPWLLRILHNVFYSTRKRRRLEPTLLDDVDFDHFEQELSDGRPDAAAGRIDWERVDEELKAAVEELLPEYRITLLLWAIEGMSYRQIASACDCAMGTVMSRLYRARQVLGRSLAEYAQSRGLNAERLDR